MRELSIDGVYIRNAIGYCECDRHKGAVNREIAVKHKCMTKKCKYLTKYSEEAWQKDRYCNNHGNKHRF